MKTQNNSPQSFWTLTRVGLVGSAILLVAAIASALYNREDSQPAMEPDIADTQAAPSAPPANPSAPRELPSGLMQANLSLLDGQKKKLADYAGKVLVVNLWATWCGPCRQEMPHLIRIAKEYKSKGVEILGLTTEDPMSDAEVVKDFSRQFKINYPIGWADPQMRIGLTQGRSVIPQTFIIGRDGKVRNHFVGFNAAISVPQMKAALDEAVSGE
ncbi:MAG: TlpA family protein disulfide reductase [Acidobacteria bacterium]|nr:TlpA family protein disulfide reductase [Acidobacteriota bacterium]